MSYTSKNVYNGNNNCDNNNNNAQNTIQEFWKLPNGDILKFV